MEFGPRSSMSDGEKKPPAKVEDVKMSQAKGKEVVLSGAEGKKRAPNRLVVDETTNDDNSCVALSMKKVCAAARAHARGTPLRSRGCCHRVALSEMCVCACVSRMRVVEALLRAPRWPPRCEHVAIRHLRGCARAPAASPRACRWKSCSCSVVTRYVARWCGVALASQRALVGDWAGGC